MPRKDTLLAHLAFKLTRDHELLATEGLTFILQRSDAARAALHRLLDPLVPGLPRDLRYGSEVIGEDKERPDVVGLDAEQARRVIIEGKFWAGLTANQPLTYLRSLPRGRPGVLVFTVPEARLEVLWREISARMRADGIDLVEESAEPGKRVGSLAAEPHALLLIGWPGLLAMLETACADTDRDIAESIRQLAGLCRAQDREAFLPLRPEEISAAEAARRSLNYYRLVNDVVERLKSMSICSTEGYKATSQWDGWVSYMRLGGYLTAGIKFDCTRWLDHGISPIWLFLQSGSIAAGRKALESVFLEPPREVFEDRGVPAVPIPLPMGVEYDRVVDQCAAEIRNLVDRLRPHWEGEG